MESDPKAAQYFKWAARSMWKNMAVRDDFGSFYWTPVKTYEEELKQEKAGGFPDEIPAEVWDMNSTVVLKSEYQARLNIAIIIPKNTEKQHNWS